MKKKHSFRYNTKESLLYLASRFVPDYAALVQIFREIKKKDVNFQPKYLFDFASGTGSGLFEFFFGLSFYFL
jgi:ribosomal protein RSM22 (predicted rRNA methylase)